MRDYWAANEEKFLHFATGSSRIRGTELRVNPTGGGARGEDFPDIY